MKAQAEVAATPTPLSQERENARCTFLESGNQETTHSTGVCPNGALLVCLHMCEVSLGDGEWCSSGSDNPGASEVPGPHRMDLRTQPRAGTASRSSVS